MSEAAIRNLLQGMLGQADPDADLFDEDRYDEDPDKYLEMLWVGSRDSGVHAWILTCAALEVEAVGWDESAARYAKLWTYAYEAKLLMARDDTRGTGKIALARALQVMHAFDRSSILHGLEPLDVEDEGRIVLQPTPGDIARLARPTTETIRGSSVTHCHKLVITQRVREFLS